MKKTTLALLLGALAISPALAKPFQGAYIGAGAGFTRANTKASISVTENGVAVPGVSRSKSFKKTGANLELFAGYGWVLGSAFYLGAEANVGLDTTSGKTRKNYARVEYKSGMTYGAAGRMGVLLGNSSMLYARAGYQGISSKAKFRADDGNDSNDGVVAKQGVSRSGFVLGGGAEHYFNNAWFARAEYRYNLGSKKKVNATFIDGGDVVTVNGRIKTSSHTFLLGVGYKF